MEPDTSMRASVVIPTRDRNGELRELLRSLQAQTVPLEIIVMDDSETGAAGAMLEAEFPAARYFRLASNRGPTYQRNRGIELASAGIVFPVDDDTLFVSPHTVEQTLADFADPAIGAVAIPYVNVRQDQAVRQRAPHAQGIFLTFAFTGAAHALRREAFLGLGGYRESFFYMGEESDYCIRLYERGYAVRLGTADPIHHLESPIRNFARSDYLSSRNQLLFVWHNVPAAYLVPHLALTTAKIFWHALAPRRLWRRCRAIGAAYAAMVGGKAERRPVRAATYRAFRFLSRREASLDDLRSRFQGLLR